MLLSSGSVNRHFFAKALSSVEIPKHTLVAVVDSMESCASIVKDFPPLTRKVFLDFCAAARSSFSFTHNSTNFIIILARPNSIITKDPKAFLGLLYHEMAHLKCSRSPSYKRVMPNYHALIVKSCSQFKGKNRIIARQVGVNALLFLRDLYANEYIVRSNDGPLLLYYYKKEFSHSICPKPILYRTFYEEISKHPEKLPELLSFEFAILSITLPLQKIAPIASKRFRKHIESCYQTNIHDLQKGCEDIAQLYLNSKKLDDAFQKMFFSFVLSKMKSLLRN